MYARCPTAPPRPAVAALLAQRRAISNWDAFAAANTINGWDAATPVCSWTGIVCKPTSTTANKFDMCAGGVQGSRFVLFAAAMHAWPSYVQ